MGTIFKYKGSKNWWINYYRNGKPFRESTKTEDYNKAKRLLKLREGQIVEGKFPGLKIEKIIFEELAQDFINDYLVNERKALDCAQRYVEHLGEHFEAMRVVEITTDKIKVYIATRQAQGRENATINRELSALKRMFYLGAKHDPPKVLRVPYIPMLKESNVRSGFFEYNEFVVLRANLPDYLRPVVTMGYYSGWRKSEILSLTWNRVDLVRDCIRRDPGTTKNNEARTLFLEGKLLETIQKQKVIRDCQYPDCPWVFFNEGSRIKGYRKAWTTACKKVGLEGRIFHDFRRTAIRNMVRAGIPERVAMPISGHKTRSVFERYNIVSQEDLKQAASKLNQYVRKETFRVEEIDQFIESLQSPAKP